MIAKIQLSNSDTGLLITDLQYGSAMLDRSATRDEMSESDDFGFGSASLLRWLGSPLAIYR